MNIEPTLKNLEDKVEADKSGHSILVTDEQLLDEPEEPEAYADWDF